MGGISRGIERLIIAANLILISLAVVYLAFHPASIARTLVSEALSGRQERREIRNVWPELMTGGLTRTAASELPGKDTIVVFSDYECPYCRKLEATLRDLERARVLPTIVYRHLPMPYHARARFAARVATCASDVGGFEQVHDWLMQTDEWQTDPDSLQVLGGVPESLKARVTSCLVLSSSGDELVRDSVLASQLDIQGTPTVVTRKGKHSGVLEDDVLRRLTRPRS